MRHSFECLRRFLAGGPELAEAASYESDLPRCCGITRDCLLGHLRT